MDSVAEEQAFVDSAYGQLAILNDHLRTRMDEIALAWMSRKAELREAFLADVRAMLRPEQAVRWPAFHAVSVAGSTRTNPAPA